MKKKLTFIIAPVVFCWCLFYLTGCKEPLIEDNNLLTSDDDLNLAKDTLQMTAFSQYEVPLKANGVTVGLLGSLADPAFGNTYAGLYSQFLLTSNNVYFGQNPILDSAVLIVRYSGLYGKFDQPVDISVFELAQSINDTTTYKTNDAFAVQVPAIGTLTGFTPKLTDSVKTQYGTLAPHLRIKLTDAFGNKLLTADSSLVLRDNSSFLGTFKGFYLTTGSATTGNGLVYLDLASSISSIVLYYKSNTGGVETDSLSYRFPLSGVRINHFDNVYTGAPVNTSVTSPNPAGEEKVYLQGGVGVKGKLFIKDLDSLPKNIAINKAEIILSQSNGATDTTYIAPTVLNLYRIDDAGQTIQLEDDVTGTGFGGVRTAENVNGTIINRYRFNIKRYFQKLIRGIYPNKGFYVEIISPTFNSERVVLSNSSTDKNYQITLVVTYTKL
ncbi:MAG TPA: DUF4270 domain-containing protein [Chitinophagales bacterium]|nr:DUF4270 domain-containing protein [Chitinophagales bacterium]